MTYLSNNDIINHDQCNIRTRRYRRIPPRAVIHYHNCHGNVDDSNAND